MVLKEFADDVKAYVSEKWDVVSKWCKKTATLSQMVLRMFGKR